MIKTIKEFLTSKFLRNDLIRNKEEIKLSIGKILCEVFKDKNQRFNQNTRGEWNQS